MGRKPLGLLILAAAFAVPAGEARAQTLVPPNPACLVGACREDRANDMKDPKPTSCPLPATLVCAGGSLIGGAVDAVGDAAQAGVTAAGAAVMGGLTSWVAGGAAWLLSRAGRLLDRSTRPALGSTWFRAQYRTMLELAVALCLLFLLCAIAQAVIRQDVRGLVRSALLALPLALLLCFAAVTLVETALGVTDWMTGRVLARFDRDTSEFLSDVGEILVPTSLSGSPVPGFLLFLGALVTALATFLVWLELVMREAAIYIAVVFLPLTFSAMVWERTAHWCRRLVELLVAVILAKLTIAVAIALAAGAMAHGRGGEGGLTALMAGSAVMLIAAFTPFLLLRLIPLAEAAAYTGLQRGAARGAVGSAPGAQTGAMIVRQVVLQAAVPASGAARLGPAGREALAAHRRPTPGAAGPLPAPTRPKEGRST